MGYVRGRRGAAKGKDDAIMEKGREVVCRDWKDEKKEGKEKEGREGGG